MGFGEFLLWMDGAHVNERSDAARMIARTTLRQDIDLEERCTAEAALSLLLDDPSPLVRGALSEVLSLSSLAPRQILHALALDQFEVSAAVLARSALGEETLIEVIKRDASQAAAIIADRANLPARVAMAIAERCGIEPCLILITNRSAKMTASILSKIIERHHTSPEMRGALLADQRLDLTARQKLIDASSHAVCTSNFVQRLIGAHRAVELERETVFDSSLDLVEYAELEALPKYVHSLHQQGRLTNALAMKSLVYGRIDFVATIMSDLSARSEDHIRAVLVRGGENAIRALLKDIGFSGLMLQLALRALLTWRDVASGKMSIGRQELAWQLMREAETAERGLDHNPENDNLAAFMRKIYLEITRTNARAHASDILLEAKHENEIQRVAATELEYEIAELMLAEQPLTALEQIIQADKQPDINTVFAKTYTALATEHCAVPIMAAELEISAPVEVEPETELFASTNFDDLVAVANKVSPDILVNQNVDGVFEDDDFDDDDFDDDDGYEDDEVSQTGEPVNGPLFEALERFEHNNASRAQISDAAFFARFAELMSTEKDQLEAEFESKFSDAISPRKLRKAKRPDFRQAA
jgi:uncharacterized protein (DUF2336 family)